MPSTRKLSKWIVAIPMAALALATIYPLVFTTNVAMKTRREYVLDRFALADSFSFANIVNGTGSLVLTDDLEIYNRIDMGLSSEGAQWLQVGRGYRSDQPDAHGGRKGVNSTSEVYIRNMLEAWQGYMNDGQKAAHDDSRTARAAS